MVSTVYFCALDIDIIRPERLFGAIALSPVA